MFWCGRYWVGLLVVGVDVGCGCGGDVVCCGFVGFGFEFDGDCDVGWLDCDGRFFVFVDVVVVVMVDYMSVGDYFGGGGDFVVWWLGCGEVVGVELGGVVDVVVICDYFVGMDCDW